MGRLAPFAPFTCIGVVLLESFPSKKDLNAQDIYWDQTSNFAHWEYLLLTVIPEGPPGFEEVAGLNYNTQNPLVVLRLSWKDSDT